VGDLYVVDSWHNVVVQFDGTTGARVGTFAGGMLGATGLAFGPDGNLYVAHTSLGGPAGVDRFDGNTGAFLGEFASSPDSHMSEPGNILFGSSGNLFVPDRSFGGVYEFDGSTGAFVRRISSPVSVAVAFLDNHNLLVADYDAPRILEYAMPSATPLGVFVTLPEPAIALAWGPNGNLFALTALPGPWGRHVVEIDPAGNVLRSFQVAIGATQAVNMTFGLDGLLYILDAYWGRVVRYDPTSGTYLDDFAGGLYDPWGLTFKVPEPATVALLLVGGLALSRRR